MRWENRCTTLRVLLAIGVLLAIPHLSSLLGRELLRGAVAPLDGLLGIHRYREITGYVGLGLVLAALLISLRPVKVRLPFLSGSSRAVHITVGVLLLLAILLHTGGKWGAHLNGLLLASLQLAIFIALTGKLLENQRLDKRDGSAGRVRAVWMPAHLVAVAALLVFLAFHIFSVYYF
jgi:nitrite reductase (NADH) large subunit